MGIRALTMQLARVMEVPSRPPATFRVIFTLNAIQARMATARGTNDSTQLPQMWQLRKWLREKGFF